MAINWEQYAIDDEQTNKKPNEVDWEQYSVAPEKSNMQENENEKIPFLANLGLKLAQSYMRPAKEAVPERITAMGRGFQDIGEGLKQLYLEKFGSPEAAKDYTNRVQAERKFYEQKMPHDVLSDTLRSVASSSPYAIGGPETLLGKNLLSRVLAGGITGSTVGGSQFVPEGQSRLSNILEQGLTGAGVSLIPSLPSILKSASKSVKVPFDIVKGAFKDLKPIEKALESAKLESQYAKEALQESKSLLPGQITNQPTSNLEKIEDQLGRNLNIGAAHHIRVTNYLRDKIGNIEKYWSDRYKNFVDKLSGSRFLMPEQKLKQLDDMDAIRKAVQEGRLEDVMKGKINKEEKISPYLKELYDRAPTSKDIYASDFLSKYKDFRNGLYQLRQLAKNTPDEGLRHQLFKDIEKAKESENTIKDVLEEGLGEHAPEFKEINKGYSDQIFPLRQNKTVRKIMNQQNPGNLSSDIAKELAGEGHSKNLLRNLIKQDEESVRNVLGQQYAKNPKSLHNPNEIVQDYMNELPEIKDILDSKVNELKNMVARKNISLREKIKLEAELEKLKRKKSKDIAFTAGGLTVLGAPTALKYLFKNTPVIKEAGENQ